MRVLVLMRGGMGAGKSTWLSANGLDQYTLSPDVLRTMFGTPELKLNGKFEITQKLDKEVWPFLFKLLEERMKRGELTIIDATHKNSADFQRYKDLCHKYRYRAVCVDFTDIPIEVCKAQNAARPEHKVVPEEAIEIFYERIKSQPVPNWVKTQKPAEFLADFSYRISDWSEKYDQVHIIGDIQGCDAPLSQFFGENNEKVNPRHGYVFLGDYVDRGPQNHLVVKRIMELAKLPNTHFIPGNHEDWLRDWANDAEFIRSPEFRNKTKPQLEAAGIKKKDVREFLYRMGQVVYFYFRGKAVLVTHGGLSTMPPNLLTMSTEQLVHGVGKYEVDIDAAWTENTAGMVMVPDQRVRGGWLFGQFSNTAKSNLYQVHGHRNSYDYPIQAAERSFNLEGKVEFGGNLRIASLDEAGNWFFTEIENTVLDAELLPPPPTEESGEKLNLLEQMRRNKLVMEKPFGNISSFIFKREVFHDRLWNSQNVKARGLFINTVTGEIVCRSYNKFFNVGERRGETDLQGLNKNFTFPVTARVKPNGFLGITGYDADSDELLTASKSTIDGPFAKMFREVLTEQIGEDGMEALKEYLKVNGVSATFEVIDPVRDPHIIKYDKPHVVLLDLVNRDEVYSKRPVDEARKLAEGLGVPFAEVDFTFETWTAFLTWYNRVSTDMSIEHEGWVLEDVNGFMTKVKLPFYSFWKKMRWLRDELLKKQPYIKGGFLTTVLDNQVYRFMRSIPKEELAGLSVIEVRDRFWASQEALKDVVPHVETAEVAS